MLLITFLFGGTAKAQAGWSKPVKIASVEASNTVGPNVYLTFTSAPFPNHNCSNKHGSYRLGGGDANVNQMTLLATAALINSRNVAVYWSGGCDSGGTNGYPILVGLILK
jgi:hypothetical protein